MTLITQVWQRILFAENCRHAQNDLNPPPYHHEKPTALVFTLANILCAHIGRYRWMRPPANLNSTLANQLEAVCIFIGQLFMNALKMMIVPLIVASIISGVLQMANEKGLGRIGLKPAPTTQSAARLPC